MGYEKYNGGRSPLLKKDGFQLLHHQTMCMCVGLSPWGYSPGIARVCVCVCVVGFGVLDFSPRLRRRTR